MYDQCGLLPLTHCVMTGKLLSFLHLDLLLYKWEILFPSKTLWDPWIKGDYFLYAYWVYKFEVRKCSKYQVLCMYFTSTQYNVSCCSLWIVLKHLVVLKTSVKHKQKEVFRPDLGLETVFCSSLFIVSTASIKLLWHVHWWTTIQFSLIRQALCHLQMK